MNMKLKKYYEYFFTKFYRILKERIHNYKNYKIKYLFEEGDTSDLIIIFSACTRKGIKSRYNYVKTLNKFKANKLYILDYFGYDKRGVYYIGENGDYSLSLGIEELISKIKHKYNSKRVFYVGSSKGGTSALYYGLNDINSIIIIGGPQYYIGTYLGVESNDLLRVESITGSKGSGSIELLNKIIANRVINSNKNNNNIYLHYSINEHTYENHIVHLKSNLINNDYRLLEDIGYYENHNDISLFFPTYLTKILSEII